jgi:putative CocE/NonD family hydrolase
MTTTIVRDFPHAVRVIENDWVSLPDGTRLAAKIWLPGDAEAQPAPAVFEFLPYRKGDGTATRDEVMYRYLAGHGYAGVRVDLRGHGESEGSPDDEYTRQEHSDAVDVIAWIAEQQWCSGSVGMTGISWGGFNSLQVAALRPPALKAIMTLCSTDDRYADDVHYKGGAVQALDMLHWGVYMLLANAEPPDPAIVGDAWRDMWDERARSAWPLAETWLEHQRRDEYWKHGSVCEDYSAIECAVYAAGGWQDGYSDAIPRLLEGLECPRKGLIGPWGHTWPEFGSPGPAIGFLQECVRWWDHWLKGEDTGIMDEPMLRVWVQDSVRPSPTQVVRPGRWVTADSWPPQFASATAWSLNDGSLDESDRPSVERRILGRQTCGLDAGAWCGEGETADDPDDQRADDGMSMVFDSAPLEVPIAILGAPMVTLDLASDRPQAAIVVRLCEVLPDGASLLVTRQLLNLTHRDGHEHPQPLEPGRRHRVSVELDDAGHRFAAGSRIRVAVSPTYWPMLWPSPEPVTLSVFTGEGSGLELPVIPLDAPTEAVPFGPPEAAEPLAVVELAKQRTSRALARDVQTGRTDLAFRWNAGSDTLYPHGMRVAFDNEAIYTIVEGDPLSAEVNGFQDITYRRDESGWKVRILSRGRMTCDRDSFLLEHWLTTWESDEPVHERTWSRSIPRDHS